MNHPQLRQAVENAIKGANLEIVEKNYPSCSVKILVLWYEKILIDVVNYYEHLLRNYKEV